MKDTDKHARPELAMTETIRQLPLACQDETAAVEFIEKQRWGKTPCCAHCGSVNVYKMLDAKTGGRSKRFLWRCREQGCGKQYTVRIGTVYEESRIELRHWCYAFWRAATSKKGVAALEIMRHCGMSYKSALFLMHRIRWAMTPHSKDNAKKMHGTVEADETYVGGKPRPKGKGVREVWSTKTPVFGIVERGGDVHRRVIADVSGKTVYSILKKRVGVDARVMTDEAVIYQRLGEHFDGGHHTVCHSAKEYARGDVHTNTIESSFALIKRGLMGIHHAVSKKHLHRYLAHYDFLWNCRKMNDGDRTVLAIQSAEGKRLMYRTPVQ
jgi:transposase-like protein